MRIALLLLLTLTANAQNWEHFTDSDEQKVFTDISTMTGDSKSKQMWLKFVPISRTAYIAKMKLPRSYDHLLTLLSFQCGSHTYTAKQSIWYSGTGKVLRRIESTKATDIVPESLNAEIYSLLCSP